MRTIGRFEANLLQILHCFLGRAPAAQTLPLLLRTMNRPPGLSRDAVALVQDALAKGCVMLVARGGWRRQRYLREGQPAEGRLWQRSSPEELGLSFSPNALDFLMWATAEKAAGDDVHWQPSAEIALTTGDRYLLFLAYGAVRKTAIGAAWRRPPFSADGLCRLAFPEDFADGALETAPDYRPWTSGPASAILESMQHDLTRRWLRLERQKGRIVQHGRMQAVGRSQECVLEAFFDAVDEAGRRDLTRFLLATAARLLRDRPGGKSWVGELGTENLRLAERIETYQAAFAFLRGLERLQDWQQQARAVGYFDEGYAAAQLWKADWETFDGDTTCDVARGIVRRWDPLHAARSQDEQTETPSERA